MDFHVSVGGRGRLTNQIYGQLRTSILEGRLRPGDRLPPTRELASRLNVARTTVVVAYDRLAGEGYVTSRTGSGTFVSSHVVRPVGPQDTQGSGSLRPRPMWETIRLATAFLMTTEYDFRTGLPDVGLFPWDTWRRLMSGQLRHSAVGTGVYGDPAGDESLREAIARHVGVSRAVTAPAEDVVVTAGAQQAIGLAAQVLLSPGDLVAVEDPGYEPPRQAFAAHGARVVGVPVDGDGLVVDAIPAGVRAVYVTPSHHYPLGMTMSLPRRLALLDWAQAHDAAIVEDDYDSEFRFGDRPIEPLHLLDTDGRVLYVGSFSKTMFPTLRLGFAIVPPSLRHAMHAAKFVSDWHAPREPQLALAQFLDSGGFARHVRKMRGVYEQRHARIADVVNRDFAQHLELVSSSVGLHLAAYAKELSVQSAREVLSRSYASGVALATLSAFSVGRHGRAGFVFGYGAIPLDQIEEGLGRFLDCFATTA